MCLLCVVSRRPEKRSIRGLVPKAGVKSQGFGAEITSGDKASSEESASVESALADGDGAGRASEVGTASEARQLRGCRGRRRQSLEWEAKASGRQPG